MSLAFDYHQHLRQLQPLLLAIDHLANPTKAKILQLVRRYPDKNGNLFSLSQIRLTYQKMAGREGWPRLRPEILSLLVKKPTRTMSGVTPVTVLTKPFPCPGKCIFCPGDVRMPKSYLSNEPGAQRAERNYFDPYLQVYNRLAALQAIGHHIDKVELIVLGGTWSFYPESYQIWFIKECFRALNDFGYRDDRRKIEDYYDRANQKLRKYRQINLTNDPRNNQKKSQNLQRQINGDNLSLSYNQVISQLYVAPEKIAGTDQYQRADWRDLLMEQKKNEKAGCRSVGLVLETRPDYISQAEVIRLRKLGCTKVQIGVQSLQDRVLDLNKRGHSVADSAKAFSLLRQAGFKIHAHWMANLYGSNVELDKKDFQSLFQDVRFCPDELKIYPCSLISSAELMEYYRQGKWRPYEYDELLEVVSFALAVAPPYCRLTRVIRDIPSDDIVVGNKKTNFRQLAQDYLRQNRRRGRDIRVREIRNQKFSPASMDLREISYQTADSQEIFLQFVAETEQRDDNILAFLRLSLPNRDGFIEELRGSAIIREVHVYGPAVKIGEKQSGKAQHIGLGRKLIERAKILAAAAGFRRLAVISAIGTKEYYRKLGFNDGQLYLFVDLSQSAPIAN